MTAPEPPAPPTRQPTIRIRCNASGNVEAIETYQGPAGWRNILLEPIQRGGAADLVAALVDVREWPARDAACAHATTIRGAADDRPRPQYDNLVGVADVISLTIRNMNAER